MKITALETIRAGRVRQSPVATGSHVRWAGGPWRDVLSAQDSRGLYPRGAGAEGAWAGPAPDRSHRQGGDRLSGLPLDRGRSPRQLGARHRALGPVRQDDGRSRSPSSSAAFPATRFAPTTPAQAPPTCGENAGQRTANWGLDTSAKDYDDLNGFLHRADELALDLLSEGITAMKIWPFDPAAEASGGVDISTADLKTALEAVREDPGRGRRPDRHHGRVPLALAAPAGDAGSPRRSRRSRRTWHEDPIRMDSLGEPETLRRGLARADLRLRDAGDPLGLPRPPRDRRGRRHHARSLLVRRRLGSAQDRGNGRGVASSGRAARLHRPGRARRLDASVAECAKRAHPGKRARLLPHLVSRSRHRPSGGQGGFISVGREPGHGVDLQPDLDKRFSLERRTTAIEDL